MNGHAVHCPRAWELQYVTDRTRLKQLLAEAERRRRRIELYMVAIRMRMLEVSR